MDSAAARAFSMASSMPYASALTAKSARRAQKADAMRSASRLRQSGVTIGHDDSNHADVGHVGPAVAVHQRGGEHAGHALDFGHQVHHRLHRIEGGLRHLAGQQKRDFGEADGRTDAVLEDLHQHLGRFLPGLEGVVVRRGLVGHQRVDMAHRAADQVGVHVQGDRDRHARPDACAQISQQIVLAVVETLGAHRAMQRQADAVHAMRGIEDARLEPLVRVARHHPSGHGPGGHRGHELDIGVLPQHVNNAAERSA